MRKQTNKICNFQQKEIRFSGKTYTVLMPEINLQNIFVCQSGADDFTIYGNKSDLNQLALFLSFIANHNDKIIYIQSKKNQLTEFLKNYYSNSNDLVLLHHSLQFKIKYWKTLRQKLKNLNLVNYKLENTILPENDFREGKYTKYKNDILDRSHNFDTLFLISSNIIFKQISVESKDVGDWGEEQIRKYNDWEHSHLGGYLREGKKRNISYYNYYMRHSDITIYFYDREINHT